METDYFSSSNFSLVLSWVFSIPIFISITYYISRFLFLFIKDKSIPNIFAIWISFCLIFFSPLRYILWQFIIATDYAVQSVASFFSFCLLSIYVPVVFGIVLMIGVGLPLISLGYISGIINDKITNWRLWITSLLVPFLCVLSLIIYMYLTPIASYSIHWIRSKDVIKASNGPAWIFYRFAFIENLIVQIPTYLDQMDENDKTPKNLYRIHVANTYLSEEQQGNFIKRSFPQFYEKLISLEKY